MALVWPSLEGGQEKKQAWRKKKKQEKRLDLDPRSLGIRESLLLFLTFSPSPADSVPELLKPQFIPERAPASIGGPPSVDSPTGRLAVKQRGAVGPQGVVAGMWACWGPGWRSAACASRDRS